MSNFKPGGQKRRPEFIGGRPKFDTPYKPKVRHEARPNRFESRGNSDGGAAPLHKATCTTCGKPCEVPFRPDGTKPVLCRDCFSVKHSAPSDRSKGNSYERNERNDRNDRSDRKPERSFAPAPQVPNADIQNLAKQITALEEKIAKLITLHSEHKPAPKADTPEVQTEEVTKVRKPKKAVVKKAAKATKKVTKKAATKKAKK